MRVGLVAVLALSVGVGCMSSSVPNGSTASPGGGSPGASNGSGSNGNNGGGSNGGSGSNGGGPIEGGGGSPGALPNPLFVGYYQSWTDQYQAAGSDTVLAKLPSYINVVNLSFMQPDTTYVPGSLVLRGTTYLDVPYDGPTLKDAIATLRQRQPGTKIMISVGGATLYNWGSFHPDKVAAVVADFGFDGVDLDYEPAVPNCMASGGTVSCPSDQEFVAVIQAMRAALPRPKLLSIAAWSVGAYGEGQWANALPTGSAYTGIALAVLKNSAASSALDFINVMSYDAGPTYDPKQALAAYQHYFKGKIAMGIEVPPEAWGGHVETTADIDALAGAVKQANGGGLMLWSIQKQGPGQAFANEICTQLGLGGCGSPMM
jgi:chitinase